MLVSAKKVKAKKFKGSVVAKKIVDTDEYGAPVYKKIGKAKLRNGKAIADAEEDHQGQEQGRLLHHAQGRQVRQR